MALLDPTRSESPTTTALVAALVFVHEGSAVREALEAVERQVYEPETVVVVGASGALLADLERFSSARTVADAMAALDPSITHVWLLHDDSIPRPDALHALVREGRRLAADLVGSKILAAGRPGVLESVGFATDVFEVPASGLDTDELDQEQYDVLRDVAFVAGSSMLVERAMFERVGGPDRRLEPITAALDLCQRVRLAGGRVAVVPSAEVLHDGTCTRRSKLWRVEAGRLRAMLKAYSIITLVWVLPFNFVLGLAEAVVSPLFGRWRLWSFVRAWAWNLVWLPSTLNERRRVERVVGDTELFRFQMRGSVRLTSFARLLLDRLSRLGASEGARSLGHLVESGGETVRRPVVASLVGGVTYAVFATRQLWLDGVPAVGYALAPPGSVAAALRAYAGGWNPSGLGSPEPLRPVFGLVTLIQVAMLGHGSLALTVIIVGAVAAGVVGVARLLGPFGIRPAARYAAGVVLVAGPAARFLAGGGVWHAMVATAVLPWILTVLLHRRRTVPAVAAAALLTAVGAALEPLMLLIPVALALVWAFVDRGDRFRTAGRAGLASLFAAPALLPWIGAFDDPATFFAAGADFFWEPSRWVASLVSLCAATVLAFAGPGVARVGGWAALTAAGGAILARTGSFGWGTDPGAAGMILVGLGTAVLVGCALEAGATAPGTGGWHRAGRVVGALTAGLLVVGTVTFALPGRGGFPKVGLEDTLSFTAEAVPGRALLLGDEAMMPGGGRLLSEGIHYRVVSTPDPRLWEAWPTPGLAGDRALDEVLSSALSGGSFRLGQDLAGFGIGWIIVTGSQPVDVVLEPQLDLVPLALPGVAAYEVSVPAPRALDQSGVEWIATGTAYVGPASGGTVRIAENGDTRWGPEWEQDGWANRVTVDSGIIEFGPVPRLRIAALASLIWAGVLVLAAAVARDREPPP